MRQPIIQSFTFIVAIALLCSCKTKSELRREQEMERLKQEVTEVKGDRADIDATTEEFKGEITRLANLLEEQSRAHHQEVEELHKELSGLTNRLQTLEQRIVAEETAAKQTALERSRATYENGKRLFDEGKYEEAIEILKGVIKNKKRGDENRKARYLLAESYYASKDFASAALEFSEYKKSFSKDALIPNAILRQAQSFRQMGKTKEAKLFYQELIERYPKNSLSAKAKKEMKGLRRPSSDEENADD